MKSHPICWSFIIIFLATLSYPVKGLVTGGCIIDLSESRDVGRPPKKCFFYEIGRGPTMDLSKFKGEQLTSSFMMKHPPNFSMKLTKNCYLNWSKHQTKSGSIPDIVCFCFGGDGKARADGGIDLFCLKFNDESPRLNVQIATIEYSEDDQLVRKCRYDNVPRFFKVGPRRACSCETKDGEIISGPECSKFKGTGKRPTFLYI
ncbi:uncharacterized protein LOC141852454 [Brevipalpus obovatus]|uniref:uncharacterized protein LOC141852454 n=1 Tax=Brevipalpus obovatus TaxID=246614 RepID=UPI003D9E1A8F